MDSRLVGFADHYWSEYLGKIAAAVEPLTEEQVWWRPREGGNSIGNLLAHLDGNLRQWVLEGLGGEAYERHRDAEFAARRLPVLRDPERDQAAIRRPNGTPGAEPSGGSSGAG